MELGVSTSCLYPLETEKSLELVAKNGVKSCEIFFNATCELEPDFVDILYRIKKEYGTQVISLHPTLSLAESFMIFSAYERRIQEGLDKYRRYGEIAAKLGAKYVIMHGGKPNGVLDDDEYCERFLQVADVVSQNGAVLLQENVFNFRANEIPFLKNMVRNLGEKANFCLDVKQSIRGGYTPFDVLDAVGANVRHLHISDHDSSSDCLLPLDGDFDFIKLFERMKDFDYDGAAMIEVYSWAYKNYDQIFSSYKNLRDKIG